MTDHARRTFRFDDPAVKGYPLLTSLVVPRPIAWVSTVSADGIGNLAPHSFFSVACADPAILSVTSVGTKDTLRNVLDTGELVVSLTPRWLSAQVNATGARFEAGVDESEVVDLAMEASEQVRPQRVAESPAAFECRLHSAHELGNSTLILATVLSASIWESALDGDHPRFEDLQPLSRLGRDEWGLPPEVFRLRRPSRGEDALRQLAGTD